MKIAILDDYQNVALKMADWSAVTRRAQISVFNDHISDPDAIVERLLPFEIVCVMRERTPLTCALMLAGARPIFGESSTVRDGGCQQSIGEDLDGRVRGVLGLGRIGSQV